MGVEDVMKNVWGLLFLSLVAGACAGNGCSCASPLPDGFPAADRHPTAMQMRVTQSGVTFLERNASSVVGGLVPGGLTFTVPESCGGDPEVCCGQPASECGVAIDLSRRDEEELPRLQIDAAGDSALDVTLRARIRTTDHLK